jgi:hypothetical protein
MSKEQNERAEIALFFSYLLTSARGLINEPRLYGSLRLLDGMILLSALLRKEFGYENEDLSAMVEELEKLKLLCMTDEAGFITGMDKQIVKIGEKGLPNKQRATFLFFSSMLTSARELVNEPPFNGLLRLGDTMVRLDALLRKEFGFVDPDLSVIIEDLDKLKHSRPIDEKDVIAALDDKIIRMIQLVKKL